MRCSTRSTPIRSLQTSEQVAERRQSLASESPLGRLVEEQQARRRQPAPWRGRPASGLRTARWRAGDRRGCSTLSSAPARLIARDAQAPTRRIAASVGGQARADAKPRCVPMSCAAGHHVLEHRQARPQARGPAASGRPPTSRVGACACAGNSRPLSAMLPDPRADEAADDVEERGLAGPVRTDHADHLAETNAGRHPGERRQAAEPDAHVADHEADRLRLGYRRFDRQRRVEPPRRSSIPRAFVSCRPHDLVATAFHMVVTVRSLRWRRHAVRVTPLCPQQTGGRGPRPTGRDHWRRVPPTFQGPRNHRNH